MLILEFCSAIYFNFYLLAKAHIDYAMSYFGFCFALTAQNLWIRG